MIEEKQQKCNNSNIWHYQYTFYVIFIMDQSNISTSTLIYDIVIHIFIIISLILTIVVYMIHFIIYRINIHY